MGLNYLSLDDITRKLMLEEFKYDIDCENCYTSKRFHEVGRKCYIEIMPQHILEGTDDSLASALKANDCFNSHEPRGANMVKVPVTAAQTFAEGEFNRFYIRGVCLRAINEGREIEVYRARTSGSPRPESEALIGRKMNPSALLKDLRDNKGFETALGLPPGPNSGLSIKMAD